MFQFALNFHENSCEIQAKINGLHSLKVFNTGKFLYAIVHVGIMFHQDDLSFSLLSLSLRCLRSSKRKASSCPRRLLLVVTSILTEVFLRYLLCLAFEKKSVKHNLFLWTLLFTQRISRCGFKWSAKYTLTLCPFSTKRKLWQNRMSHLLTNETFKLSEFI